MPSNEEIPIQTIPCPSCTAPVDMPCKISLENLRTVSMIMWTHENAVVCKSCGAEMIPQIRSFRVDGLQWVPIQVNRPIVDRPGIIDISKMKM